MQHMRKCIMSSGSPLHSSCLPRSTGILPFLLWEEAFAMCVFFFVFFFKVQFPELKRIQRGKNVWCRIPAINKKKGEKKKKKGKNGKRVLIHKHLHFCKHKQASTTTPPPDKKQDFCHKHLPKYTERTNTQNTKYVQSNTCTPEHLSSLRVEVEVGCTCFSQGVLGFH